MKYGNRGVVERIRLQPDYDECIMRCGVYIEAPSVISITAFCWANGLDVGMVAFDIRMLDEGVEHED